MRPFVIELPEELGVLQNQPGHLRQFACERFLFLHPFTKQYSF